MTKMCIIQNFEKQVYDNSNKVANVMLCGYIYHQLVVRDLSGSFPFSSAEAEEQRGTENPHAWPTYMSRAHDRRLVCCIEATVLWMLLCKFWAFGKAKPKNETSVLLSRANHCTNDRRSIITDNTRA